ncbi:MAG: aspartate-semialdehyde dehydrogenase [bacterium]
MRKYDVAVVGATGMVGRTFVKLLEEREFPIAEIRLLASENSEGERIKFFDQDISIEVLKEDSFQGIDLAFFSAGVQISKKFAPMAAESGAIVIDNSSAFRMVEGIPLVVPEVNPQALKMHRNIIANPNCSTIQMVVAAKPLHDAASIKRIVVSTYQAVSGTGKAAMQELQQQCEAFINKDEITEKTYPYQIAFNLLPHIDSFLDGGDTKEEQKMVMETRKILEEPELSISATCVRVPVFNGHSLSLNLEFEQPLDVETARTILSEAPGVLLMDEPKNALYPTPLTVSGTDQVFVGRVRQDTSVDHGLNLWIVADNLRKGAALNAIQIAEMLT